MFRKAFIFVLIFILSSLAVSAQLEDDANACAEGGSMEGKCNIDFNGDGEVSDYEVTWAWTCGWYMIRYDAGVFSRSQVPVFCSSLLPAEVEETASEEEGSGPGYCSYAYESIYYIYQIVDGDFVFSHPSDTTEGYPACDGEVPLPG